MKNKTMRAESFDNTEYVDSLTERLQALANDLNEHNVPFIIDLYVRAEDEGMSARSVAGYGDKELETGWHHDILADLIDAKDPAGMIWAMKNAIKNLERFQKDHDAPVEQDNMEMAAYVHHDYMAALLLKMQGRGPLVEMEQENGQDDAEEEGNEEDNEENDSMPSLLGSLIKGMVGGGVSNDEEDGTEEEWEAFRKAREAGAEDGTPELCGVCPHRNHCPKGREVLGL